jgi:hypothetical protein
VRDGFQTVIVSNLAYYSVTATATITTASMRSRSDEAIVKDAEQ